jgi:5-methylcytosine-specific restriction endonuclease McrA
MTDDESVARYGVHLHFDHIVPFSRNGADTVNNIQLRCEQSNLAKGNRYIG